MNIRCKPRARSDAFASAMIRLANQNLGEVDPEKWVVFLFYSHPPLGERIDNGEELEMKIYTMNEDNYFVHVERLNNTGSTTINTMMTPINVIQSVDPACEVASAEALV